MDSLLGAVVLVFWCFKALSFMSSLLCSVWQLPAWVLLNARKVYFSALCSWCCEVLQLFRIQEDGVCIWVIFVPAKSLYWCFSFSCCSALGILAWSFWIFSTYLCSEGEENYSLKQTWNKCISGWAVSFSEAIINQHFAFQILCAEL